MDVIASVCHKNLPQSQVALNLSSFLSDQLFQHAVDVGRKVAVVRELEGLLNNSWTITSVYQLFLSELPVSDLIARHPCEMLEHPVGLLQARVTQMEVEGSGGGHIRLHYDRKWGPQFLDDLVGQEGVVGCRP